MRKLKVDMKVMQLKYKQYICGLATLILMFAYSTKSFAQKETFLPFLDEFSSYVGTPDTNLWEGENCFVNHSYQFLPPSVGVVTLDVVDKYGKLYNGASIYTFNADTLSSVNIRLDSLRMPIQKKLSPSDSVYLSFFIQPGGGAGNMWERIGSGPSSKDSIVLEFFDASNSSWNHVWSMKGRSCQSIYDEDSSYFSYVMIPITEDKYFNKDFKFRFLTYSTLDNNPSYEYVSNCDQWNIDYVYINYNRNFEDNHFRDIAFVNSAPSFLKKYQSMPYNQYREDEMAEDVNIKIANLYNEGLSSHYEYFVEDESNNQIHYYDGGFENIFPYSTTRDYQTSDNHAKPPIAFSFPLMSTPTAYTITHVVREGAGNDDVHGNDTIKFYQNFDNYFAYDDGTAENGFGVEPIKGSNLAVGYFLNQRDTLYAIDIYFNNTYKNANIKPFYICLWDATTDSIPNEKKYQTEKLTPQIDSLNQFTRYILEEPQILEEGEFFVSLEVKNADYLNIGFDQNNDASQYTFAKVSNYWEQSFNKGAVMIRPYFGYKSVSLADISQENISFYPNPASSFISINGAQNPMVSIYDFTGRLLMSEKGKQNINVSSLDNGIYILRINNTTHKLVISR